MVLARGGPNLARAHEVGALAPGKPVRTYSRDGDGLELQVTVSRGRAAHGRVEAAGFASESVRPTALQLFSPAAPGRAYFRLRKSIRFPPASRRRCAATFLTATP